MTSIRLLLGLDKILKFLSWPTVPAVLAIFECCVSICELAFLRGLEGYSELASLLYLNEGLPMSFGDKAPEIGSQSDGIL